MLCWAIWWKISTIGRTWCNSSRCYLIPFTASMHKDDQTCLFVDQTRRVPMRIHYPIHIGWSRFSRWLQSHECWGLYLAEGMPWIFTGVLEKLLQSLEVQRWVVFLLPAFSHFLPGRQWGFIILSTLDDPALADEYTTQMLRLSFVRMHFMPVL